MGLIRLVFRGIWASEFITRATYGLLHGENGMLGASAAPSLVEKTCCFEIGPLGFFFYLRGDK